MEQRTCSFCGHPIEPGTGTLFIKKDGSTYYFDEKRCQRSLLVMQRVPRKFKWTRHYPRGGSALAAQEALMAQQVAAEVAAAESGIRDVKKKAGAGRGKK